MRSAAELLDRPGAGDQIFAAVTGPAGQHDLRINISFCPARQTYHMNWRRSGGSISASDSRHNRPGFPRSAAEVSTSVTCQPKCQRAFPAATGTPGAKLVISLGPSWMNSSRFLPGFSQTSQFTGRSTIERYRAGRKGDLLSHHHLACDAPTPSGSSSLVLIRYMASSSQLRSCDRGRTAGGLRSSRDHVAGA